MTGESKMKKFEFDNKLKAELNIYGVAIYNELYSYSNMKENIYTVYPNIKTIATNLKINKNTVSKYIKILEEKGFIEVFKRKVLAGNKNVYKLNLRWSNIKNKISKIQEKAIPNQEKVIPNQEKITENFNESDNINSKLSEENKEMECTELGANSGYIRRFSSKYVRRFKSECNSSIGLETDLKSKLDVVIKLINPNHRLYDAFVRDLEKVPYQSFFELIDPLFDKVKEDGAPIAIKYIHNRLKTYLNNYKYMHTWI